MRPGPRNLITDVPGLLVGNAEDAVVRSGSTVLLGERAFTAAVHVMGGAPGTRETDLLAPDKMVQDVEAIVLSGGSVYGLDAVGGVVDGLRAMGRGLAIHNLRVPVVPGAIIFDLINGGNKDWDVNPYPALGRAALAAVGQDFALGTVGAGFGATTLNLKGGLGSASAVLDSGFTVGALVIVNALGSATVDGGRHFWAAPWELNGEFGGLGLPATFPASHDPLPGKRLGEATTIAIVATDAAMSKAEVQRMATAAHDGMARAIVPSHTPYDGDLVFGVATGERPIADPHVDPFTIGHAASAVLARAIARAVFHARAMPGDLQPAWSGLPR
ncbi:MAG: P1 family peptidase [Gemmobacter sp.]|nr:P1 family peptidase [Gemmobacter sp.]